MSVKMTASSSISGKTDIDWKAFAADLGDIPVLDKPAQVKKCSRDFFWYSPILEKQLENEFGDLVAVPPTVEALKHCLKTAYRWDAPVIARGGGTGNYGQVVPLRGGLIIDTTKIDRILEIGDGFVRVEAGCNVLHLNRELKKLGWELPVFPSTQNLSTVGGFIAGGSAGIGTMLYGPLREAGNIVAIKVLSMEAEPREFEFHGRDVMNIHHSWGINGVISEVSLRIVPLRDWIGCIASFPDYPTAFAAGIELAQSDTIERKLLSVLDPRYAEYFEPIRDRIPTGRALMNTMVPREQLDEFRALVESRDGLVDLAMDDTEAAAAGVPHVYEFSYNHCNLHALKADKSFTYLQVLFDAPLNLEVVETLYPILYDDVLMHHEFARLDGKILAFDVPAVRYTSKERLYELIDIYEAHGCPVADPHVNNVEGGGMKWKNYLHLAWKKRLDPKGLLNPGKSLEWERVKHLSVAEIEAMNEA